MSAVPVLPAVGCFGFLLAESGHVGVCAERGSSLLAIGVDIFVVVVDKTATKINV